jgi:DNA-binding LacI/PurR family transcriptional regulator/DNA-binding GntR family transcriptional regulator
MAKAAAAFDDLRKRLSVGFWGPGERMPPLVDLAAEYAVSRATMWKVIGLLQRARLVHARERGAIVAGPPGTPRRDMVPTGMLWEQLKVRVGRDVLAGSFSGSLPLQIGKLALQYGVTPRTIKKALSGLVRENILRRDGRRYRPAEERTRLHERGILFISAGDIESAGIDVDPRTFQAIETFERECLRLGYRSRSISFHDHTAKGLLDLSAAIKRIGLPAGFIVNLWSPWTETLSRRWFGLVRLLAGRKVPVVVIDQSGNLALPDSFRQFTNLKVLHISSVRAGEIAASALVKAGYLRVAYVTPFYSFDWAKNRYAGLCRYYQQYGGSSARVELYGLREVTDSNDLVMAILHPSKRASLDLYQGRLSSEDLAALTSRLDQPAWQRLLDKVPQGTTTETFQLVSRFLRNLAGRNHDPHIYNVLFNTALTLAGDTAHRLYLQPLFEKILDSSKADAWVCSDDKTALSALAFLRTRAKRVPEDISILGFENWRETYAHQLSTYDFNIGGMVQQALLLIVNEKMFRSAPAMAEVDGYVVERRTTRSLKTNPF